MRKTYLIFALLASVTCLYSCTKEHITNSNKKNIIGKWAPVTERDRIYSTTGTLLKDTTYSVPKDTGYRYQTFNSDGTSYVIKATSGDTTSRLGYAINASQLILYLNGDKGDKSEPIDLLILGTSATNLELEQQIGDYPTAGTGLDVNTIYDFITDIYYTKQ